MAVSFEPYKGDKPYIFISYSHKDTAAVEPVLEELNRAGFRVWYDAGIPWTAEWDDIVADHVAKCEVLMAFHSATSAKSRHCKAEIKCALDNQRKIMSVYLEDGVQLSSGIKMYLSRRQSVKLSSFSDIGAFMDQFVAQSVFFPCKWEPQPVPESEPQPEPEPKPEPEPEPKSEPQPSAPPIPWQYDGNIQWYLDGDGTLTIAKKASVAAKTVPMPDYDWDWHSEKSSAPWWDDHDKIFALTIQGGVTSIGNYAFSDCTSLTSVTIPQSVTSIGTGAFDGCKNLRRVEVPEGAKIGYQAFSDTPEVIRRPKRT